MLWSVYITPFTVRAYLVVILIARQLVVSWNLQISVSFINPQIFEEDMHVTFRTAEFFKL